MKAWADEKIYEGEPVEILHQMKNDCFHADDFKNIEEYMSWVCRNVWRFAGKGIIIEGDTQEERALGFLEELGCKGIIEIIN